MTKLRRKIEQMILDEKAIVERESSEITADYVGVVAEHNIKCLQQVLKLPELSGKP